MQISFVEPLSRAWERMRRILFEPFELGTWLVLGFSAWLAGLASGGGAGGKAMGSAGDSSSNRHAIDSELGNLADRIAEHMFWLPLILLALVLVIVLVVLVLWISSRAKFIFLDNVVHERAAIVEPWHRFRRLGDSLFWWRLAFFAVIGGLVMLVVAAVFLPAASLSVSEALRGLSIAAIVLGVLAIMVIAVAAFFTLLLLENFVVPIMYRFDLAAMGAWRTLVPWLRRFGGWFIAYGVLFLIAAMAFQLVVLVLCLFTCCIVLLPYVGTVILLPVWVLYRAYSVEFLAQFHPDFDLFAAAHSDTLMEPEDPPPSWPLTDEEP
jgi:MFS family permease